MFSCNPNRVAKMPKLILTARRIYSIVWHFSDQVLYIPCYVVSLMALGKNIDTPKRKSVTVIETQIRTLAHWTRMRTI